MHNTNNCSCQPACPECETGPFTRNNYFTGKLLVERDFTDEQAYGIEKLRHHHQRLHGWGVVCGLKVTQHENPACRTRFVCVEPGTAIDCCGHEIVVRERECIDITRLEEFEPVAEAGRERTRTLQVCIAYRECPTEQIPVLYDECGCDDTQCAPNRILESYQLGLIVDPPPTPPVDGTPGLTWHSTVNIAHAVEVAAHVGPTSTGRLYVRNADGTVFPVNAANGNVLTPIALPSPAIAITVSNDGARLYAVIDTNPRRLLVLDTADFTLPPVQDISIPASGSSEIELAVAPQQGNLVALLRGPGRIVSWAASINAPGPPAAPGETAAGSNLRSLCISSDGVTAYAVDPAGHRIVRADLTTSTTGTAIVPPGALDLYAAAVVRSSGPDMIAAVAQSQSRLLLLSPSGPDVKTAEVENTPEDLVISAGGSWAYVLSRSGDDSFIQPVNLAKLRAGEPVTPSPAVAVGSNSQRVVLGQSGDVLYVPFTGDLTLAEGGVAVIEIEQGDCADIFWRSLNGCPGCDTANCVVLATIANYNLDDRIEDQTVPPSDPIADTNASIARIDNRTGRVLLPGTQLIAKALDCLRTEGSPGSQGPLGPAGEPGPQGPPGLGLNPGLPKIIDIGWEHGENISWEDFFTRHRYDAHPNEVRERFEAARPPALTLYFDRADMQGISRSTFRVSIEYPYMLNRDRFTGVYNIFKLDLYGYILALGTRATPHTGETANSAFTFVPYTEFFTVLFPGLASQMWLGEVYPTQFDDLRLDLPTVHVQLKGDFVWAGPALDEAAILDADNIGGRLGAATPRVSPLTGGINPSGNMTQGGDFEGWFHLTPPAATPGVINSRMAEINRFALNPLLVVPEASLDLNHADVEDLRTLPGINDAIAKRIVRARPFESIADFRDKTKLTDDQFKAIEELVWL